MNLKKKISVIANTIRQHKLKEEPQNLFEEEEVLEGRVFHLGRVILTKKSKSTMKNILNMNNLQRVNRFIKIQKNDSIEIRDFYSTSQIKEESPFYYAIVFILTPSSQSL